MNYVHKIDYYKIYMKELQKLVNLNTNTSNSTYNIDGELGLNNYGIRTGIRNPDGSNPKYVVIDSFENKEIKNFPFDINGKEEMIKYVQNIIGIHQRKYFNPPEKTTIFKKILDFCRCIINYMKRIYAKIFKSKTI